MTRIIDTPKALLVEVPEGAKRFALGFTPRGNTIMSFLVNKKMSSVKLPPGSYGQPILAGEMGEKMWGQIIPNYHLPTESPDYMLRFNLNPETTVVITKL